jgi:hypothetical protein
MNDTEKIGIQILLDKIGVLRYQYSLLRKDDKFNIFEILRKGDEEVALHSRFIAELLNTLGTHNQGNTFLNLFLKNIIDKDGDCNYDGAKVEIEEDIGQISENGTKGGRIDILITKENRKPIVIENKIYADDQKNQLLRYYNHIKDKYDGEGIIIYLTLDGKEPTDKSLGGETLTELEFETTSKEIRNKLKLFSYREHIHNWLTECIEKTSKIPGLRECLIHYQKLINNLTGDTTTMDERKELISLLGENKNILDAKKIVENWNHVKWHTEWDYWNDLQKVIEKDGFKISEKQKFSPVFLSGVIHKAQNRNPWYGIMIEIGKFKGHNVFLMIERSFGDMYFGIRMENEYQFQNSNPNPFEDLKKSLKDCFTKDSGFDDIWAGKECLTPRVNFESFNNEKTLLLCNPEVRTITIITHWNQIRSKLNEIQTTNIEGLVLTFPND